MDESAGREEGERHFRWGQEREPGWGSQKPDQCVLGQGWAGAGRDRGRLVNGRL